MVDTRSERSLSIVYWCLAAAVIGASGCGRLDAQATNRASITIDAGSVQGLISPLLHGEFLAKPARALIKSHKRMLDRLSTAVH